MAAQRQSQQTANILEAEQDHSCATGVSYGVQHRTSGRWYRGQGRFSHDAWPCFNGPASALQAARQYLRDTEVAFLELVPFQAHEPHPGYETEAAALVDAGPQPLIAKQQT